MARYDDLSFKDGIDPDLNDDPRIEAHHPDHGMVGHLTYRVTPSRPAWGLPQGAISVQQLEVPPAHRGNGVASQLMNELERRSRDIPIEHGKRTEDGKGWARNHYGNDADNHWTMNGQNWADKPKYFASVDRKESRFTPHQRIFVATCGLDHRLWTPDKKLRAEVRHYILQSINQMWNQYSPWSHWARIFFAGSEASEWTSENLEGNNDFDVLVGVDYDHFRDSNPAYRNRSSEEIQSMFNEGFWPFNGPVTITVDGEHYGPFDRTTFAIDPRAGTDIAKIKPYAAYDVGNNVWVKEPPHLPHWSLSELPSAVQKVLRTTDRLARDVLRLDEPERTQQGAALFDAWHSDRSRAFSDNGEGWWDIANLREKWLDQAGLWPQLVDCKKRYDQGLGAAPDDWSNMPKTAGLIHDHLDEIGAQEHPNVDHYRSGGMGHRDGDESKSVVGFVPTRMLFGYEGNETHNKDVVHKVRDDIKSGKGITNPLMMVYDHKNRWAYLGEGNHRLEGATEAGARTVPVRFVRGDASRYKEDGIGGPMSMHREFREPGYVPSDIHPDHFLKEPDHSKLGSSNSYPYIRNNSGMRHVPGFGQDKEPWGRYMSPRDGHVPDGWESGTVHFSNPLHVDHDGGNWKDTLAEQHGATGKELSHKLMSAGHDGVITHDKYGVGEIVDIRSKQDRGHIPDKTSAWQDVGDLPEGKRPRPKPVTRAGFAGFVAGHEYKGRGPKDEPNHIDTHLGHFARDHAEHMSAWRDHGTLGNVDLTNGVHATQSHVSQFHINRYRQNPNDEPWHLHPDNGDGEIDMDMIDQDTKDYSKHPLFVTHQGRLHSLDGHHRVAAALQNGQPSIKGWHYNLDEHPHVTMSHGRACATCRLHGPQSDSEPLSAQGGVPGRLERAHGSKDLDSLSRTVPRPRPHRGQQQDGARMSRTTTPSW